MPPAIGGPGRSTFTVSMAHKPGRPSAAAPTKPGASSTARVAAMGEAEILLGSRMRRTGLTAETVTDGSLPKPAA
jgi:hypothetical protein